jgi:hypothetical protein
MRRFAAVAIASGGYSCVVNGYEMRLEPKTDTGNSIRQFSRLVIDAGRRALFSVGSSYGDWSIHPEPARGRYTADGIDSSWSWTFSFQRAD